jgi:hypothetical protein
LFHTIHLLLPFHPSWSNNSNNVSWKVHILKHTLKTSYLHCFKHSPITSSLSPNIFSAHCFQ